MSRRVDHVVARCFPPLSDRPPPGNNYSFKRRAIPSSPAVGELELEIVPRLYAEGGLVADGRIVVDHYQDVSLPNALSMHFHNGRTTGGTYRSEPVQQRLRRARELLRTVLVIVGQTRRALARTDTADFPRTDLRGVWAIATAHAAGMLIGLMAGRGRSPKKVA